MGDVENSSSFKPFDSHLLFDKDDPDLRDIEGEQLDIGTIDISQQLKDQEINDPSIDDL